MLFASQRYTDSTQPSRSQPRRFRDLPQVINNTKKHENIDRLKSTALEGLPVTVSWVSVVDFGYLQPLQHNTTTRTVTTVLLSSMLSRICLKI
ncbi:hypothetical protein TRICI_006470 [Trichomonascus ciferrii]|uniref:Uncharacterized protein n=1 Tax=Trichomonascus ciferrii TaxID=44093 RepID=A0A642UH37_9ASCO|nr:hypothetical protein TRICI_006470 [Trichomonascus ciferrii]